MNRGLFDTIAGNEDASAPAKSSPTLGMIAVRFVILLIVIVAVFAWAWSR